MFKLINVFLLFVNLHNLNPAMRSTESWYLGALELRELTCEVLKLKFFRSFAKSTLYNSLTSASTMQQTFFYSETGLENAGCSLASPTSSGWQHMSFRNPSVTIRLNFPVTDVQVTHVMGTNNTTDARF